MFSDNNNNGDRQPKGKQGQRRKLHLLFGVVVSLLIAIGKWLPGQFSQEFADPYQLIELKTLDMRYVLRNILGDLVYMDPHIATLDIDDGTLQKEGRWQDWTRDKHARLVQVLERYQAAMVGFDIYFPEASKRFLTEEDIDRLPPVIKATQLSHYLPDYDQELAQALKEAGNVYLALTFEINLKRQNWDFVLYNTRKPTPAKRAALEAMTGKYIPIPDKRLAEFADFYKAIDIDAPVPKLAAAAKGVGFAQPRVDPDGVVRNYRLFIIYDQKLFCALAFLQACDYLQVPLETVQVYPGEYVLLPGARFPDGRHQDVKIPIDRKGQMMVNWVGDYDQTFPHYSYRLITEFPTLNRENEVLKAVKTLFHEVPEAMDDQNQFIQAALKRGLDRYEELPLVGQLVMLLSLYESQFQQNPGLTAGSFVQQMGLDEGMVSLFQRVKWNWDILNLLQKEPHLTLDEVANQLGIRRLDDIRYGYETIRHKVLSGGVQPIDYPLYFTPVVYEGQVITEQDLKDRVFFYGLTAAGTMDFNPIPYSERYPMLGLHANVFNTIITTNFLDRVPDWINLVIIIGLGVFMGWLVPMLPPVPGAFLVTGLLAVDLVTGYSLFAWKGLWIDMVGPVGVLVLSYLTVTLYNYIVERREKTFIRDAFGTFMAPAVVEQLINNPSMLQLGGSTATVTIFFSDVASFSTISEKLTPEELVNLLNEYLSEMTDIILNYEGTVDKFEGDAIMAFYGAPIPYEDHAVRGCLAALDMQAKLVQLRARWLQEGWPEIRARVGLNTGEVLVGNMGSRQRMDYTVMGDNVNLASRLEGGNKPYGTYLMISEYTYAEAQDAIEVRELDKIRVVGKTEPVTVYEVLSRKGELEGQKAKVVGLYLQGIKQYKQGNWEKALEFFIEALKIDAQDGPSKTYKQRCELFIHEPPEWLTPDWDGVYELTEK